MNKVYLLIGGNQGDRSANLQNACTLLAKDLGAIAQASPIYETTAWGIEDQPSFLNQAILVLTQYNPIEVLHIINNIENTLGRQRLEYWGARTLDIDIIFHNDAILHSARLVIPHPELQNRRFALVPLAAIAANFVHPILEKKVSELLAECPDKLEVNIFSGV